MPALWHPHTPGRIRAGGLGTPEVSALQADVYPGHLKDRSNRMPPEYRKIVDEIYTALENLNAPPMLLGIVGSWGDTLADEEVLAALRSWNAGVRKLS